jgi:hypothetical protein
MTSFGGSEIHFESNAILLGHKSDIPAALGKSRNVADGEQVQALRFGKNGGKAAFFRRADIENMAAAGVPYAAQAANLDRFTVNLRAGHGRVEDGSEGIFAKNADLEFAPGSLVGRPGDKFAEVVQVCGLDFCLGRDLLGCAARRHDCQEQGQRRTTFITSGTTLVPVRPRGSAADIYCCHVICP